MTRMVSVRAKKGHIEELAAHPQLSEDQKTNVCLLVVKMYLLHTIWFTAKHPGAKFRSGVSQSPLLFQTSLHSLETLNSGAAVKGTVFCTGGSGFTDFVEYIRLGCVQHV